jgi:hypothetical protein
MDDENDDNYNTLTKDEYVAFIKALPEEEYQAFITALSLLHIIELARQDFTCELGGR